MSGRPRAVVVGAGLAGLVAAFELSRRGVHVVVLEAARVAGGRASSWGDSDGRSIDTGLHVVADCYVNLTEILGQLGRTKDLVWQDRTVFLRPSIAPVEWAYDPLPAPLHIVRPLVAGAGSWRGALQSCLVALELTSYDAHELAQLDDVPYLEWHRSRDLGEDALGLAETAADAAAFTPLSRVSLRPIASWLLAMGRTARSGNLAAWNDSMQTCLVGPLCDEIRGDRGRGARDGRATRHGGHRGRLRDRRSFLRRHRRGTSTTRSKDLNGSRRPVPLGPSRQALRALASPELTRAAGLVDAFRLETVPALSLTVWFESPLLPRLTGVVVFSEGAMRSIADLGALGRGSLGASGAPYQFVVSRAHERWDHSDERILADVLDDLRQIRRVERIPRVSGFHVQRIGSAMFASTPGSYRLRPAASTGIANLFLAGDWTRYEATGSMEGATLSGRTAADAALKWLRRPGVAVRTVPEAPLVGLWRRWARAKRQWASTAWRTV